MGATLKEVAVAAGVSTATASRVFTNSGAVRDDTRDAVLAMAEQLGYRRGERKRPGRRRTGVIGLVTPAFGNPVFAQAASDLVLTARGHGYATILQIATPMQDVLGETVQQVDGLILWAGRGTERRLVAMGAEVPTVVINRPSEHYPSVVGVADDGLQQSVDYLRSQGHRHCAFVSGHANDSWAAEARVEAVRVACERADVELTVVGPYHGKMFDAGVHAADLVIESRATAAIATNDVVALGLMRQLTARGIRIPDDISVIGADDSDMAQWVTPALSSVSLPTVDLAHAAVTMLIDLIETGGAHVPPPGEPITVPSQLIIRDTTGPCPVRPTQD